MNAEVDYTLCLVTDRTLMRTQTLEEAVAQAIAGGCTMIQLREKASSSLEFYRIALRIREITAKRRIPLIVNDRSDIALAANADGVHIGQSDLPARVVRRLIGGGRLMGVSVSTVAEAVRAAEDGADYLGVGAMFPTGTKPDAAITSMDELRRIRNAVKLPIVVIGGINRQTAAAFKGTGVNGIAVVSAVISQKSIAAAAHALRGVFRGQDNG